MQSLFTEFRSCSIDHFIPLAFMLVTSVETGNSAVSVEDYFWRIKIWTGQNQ